MRKLIFEFATWHGLAKLRRHTSVTVRELQTSTTRLGKRLRHFVKTIGPSYDTRDLPKEIEARVRTHARKKKGSADLGAADTAPRKRELNMQTFKLHAIGHYPDCIEGYGTTDNYSTQIVSFSCKMQQCRW